MLFRLGLEVPDVDVAVLVAIADADTHACHHCAGRVGAVRAGRNQTDVAVALSFGLQVLADAQ